MDEAEEKPSVHRISYQKANLNPPPPIMTNLDFRATGVTQQQAQSSLQAAVKLRHNSAGLSVEQQRKEGRKKKVFSFQKLRDCQSDSCHHMNLSLC